MIDQAQIQQIVITVVTGILIPILTAISYFIIAWFKAKTDNLKINNKNQELNKYIDLLDDTIYDVVNGLQEEIVEDLKELSADGKLTVEDIAMIRDKCLKNINDIMGNRSLEALNSVYGDIKKAIDAKIYKELKDLKERN